MPEASPVNGVDGLKHLGFGGAAHSLSDNPALQIATQHGHSDTAAVPTLTHITTHYTLIMQAYSQPRQDVPQTQTSSPRPRHLQHSIATESLIGIAGNHKPMLDTTTMARAMHRAMVLVFISHSKNSNTTSHVRIKSQQHEQRQ